VATKGEQNLEQERIMDSTKLDFTFEVPEFQLEDFSKAFERIRRRGLKLIGEAPSMSVIDEREVVLFPGVQDSPLVKVLKVHVVGEKPRLDGWKFLGRIEHDRNKESPDVLCSVPGEKIPETLRDRGAICDHCNCNRYRKHTFIVEDTEGDIQQVGSTCIKDFFGGKDVSRILYAFELLEKAEELAKLQKVDLSLTFDNCKPWRVNIQRYISLVSAIIRERGWVSRSEAKYGYKNPTADLAWDYDYTRIRYPDDIGEGKRFMPVSVTEEDKTIAGKAIEWARSIDAYEDNEYLRNLKAICLQETIGLRDIGFAASCIRAHNRSLGQLDDFDKGKSEHIGKVGDKLDLRVKVDCITKQPSFYGGDYFIYNFLDQAGNKFTWFVSRKQDIVEGESVTLRGEVKKHDEYKGTKSTVLKKCEVAGIGVKA
jgi:hypothetical protein